MQRHFAPSLAVLALVSCSSLGLIAACKGNDYLAGPDPTATTNDGEDLDRDAATSSSNDAGDESSTKTDGGNADVRSGDVVYLLPETLEADAQGNVTKWRNGVPGSTLAASVAIQPAPVKVGSCVAFTQAEMLLMNDDGSLDPGEGDFSVTAVVSSSEGMYREFGQVPVARTVVTDEAEEAHYSFRGWALYSWYQPIVRADDNVSKFAGRLSYTLNVNTVEVVDTVLHESDTLYGVAMFRRGDDLYLSVDGQIHGPAPGASLVAQPKQRPLIIGKSDDDPDFGATAFKGKICAIVVHHGAETNEEIGSRLTALRARF